MGSCSDETQAGRNGNSPAATGVSSPCWIARTSCSASRRGDRHRLFPGGDPQPGTAALRRVPGGRLDLHAPRRREKIKEIRRDSRPADHHRRLRPRRAASRALRNTRDHDALRASVYPSPEFIDALDTSTPIADHVTVDYELRGCPIDKHQLIEAISALLKGRNPSIPTYSQCAECKLAGDCLRHGDQGNSLPGAGHPGRLRQSLPKRRPRACYGCFGPKEGANTRGAGGRIGRVGRGQAGDPGPLRRLHRGRARPSPAVATTP